MDRTAVQTSLARVRDSDRKWARARSTYEKNRDYVMARLLHEAARNFMSLDEVVEHSGIIRSKVRKLMKKNRLDPKDSKTLLAKRSSKVLSENTTLLGIDPRDMDLTSPLAYLPMGGELRLMLTDQVTSPVHDLDEPEVSLEDVLAENKRLRAMLVTLGFCPEDGDSMPCFTCGAGL